MSFAVGLGGSLGQRAAILVSRWETGLEASGSSVLTSSQSTLCCRRPAGPPPPFRHAARAASAATPWQQLQSGAQQPMPTSASQAVPLAAARQGAARLAADDPRIVRLTAEEKAALPTTNAWTGEPGPQQWYGGWV